MLTYKEYVKYLISVSVRSSIFSRLGLFSIDTINKFINQVNEYWYMGSMLVNESIMKNSDVEYSATFWYCCLVLSIVFSVDAALVCFTLISFAKIFDELNILTASSSSKMLPSEELSTCKILSSISFKDL